MIRPAVSSAAKSIDCYGRYLARRHTDRYFEHRLCGQRFTIETDTRVRDTDRDRIGLPVGPAAGNDPNGKLQVRQHVELPAGEPFAVWCARAQDVVVGKLMAWAEGHSRKHETDIYEMLVFHYLGFDPELSAAFDELYVDRYAKALGDDVAELWQALKAAARRSADRQP